MSSAQQIAAFNTNRQRDTSAPSKGPFIKQITNPNVQNVQIIQQPAPPGQTVTKIINGQPFVIPVKQIIKKQISVPFVQQAKELVEYQSKTTESDNSNSNQHKEYQMLITNLQSELDAYRSKCLHLEEHILQMQHEQSQSTQEDQKSEIFLEETKRMQLLINEKNQEIKQLQASYEDVLLKLKHSKHYEMEYLKLQELVQIRQNEIDQSRERFGQYELKIQQLETQEREKARQIEELRVQLEASKKAQVEQVKRSEIYQKKSKETYESELSEVRRSLELFKMDNEQWKSKFMTSEEIKGDQQQKIRNYEEQILRLTQEIDHLSNFIKEKGHDMEQLRQTCGSYEQQLIQCHGYEQEIRRLKDQSDQRGLEVDQWKQRYNKQMEQIDTLRNTASKVVEYEGRMALLSTEIERLQLLLKQRASESEDAKNRLGKQEMTILELRKYEQIKDQLEQKVVFLNGEIERLNALLLKRNEEIEGWKEKYSHSLSQIDGLQQSFADYHKLQDAYELRTKELEESRDNCHNLEYRNAELEQIAYAIQEKDQLILALQSEIERQKSQIQQKSEDIDKWRVQYTQQKTISDQVIYLEGESRRLKDQLEARTKELEDSRIHLGQLDVEIINLQNQRNELLGQLDLLGQDNQNLRNLLQQSGDQIQQLRQTVNAGESKNSELRQSVQKGQDYERRCNILSDEVQSLRIANGKLSAEIENLKKQNAKQEIDVQSYNIELRRLSEVLEAKKYDIEELRSKNGKLEIQMLELRKLEQQKQELENKISLMTMEFERKDYIISQKVRELEDAKQKCMQLEASLTKVQEWEKKIYMLSKEIERLENENRDYKNELDQWRYKYAQFAQLTDKVQQQLVLLVLCQSIIESQNRRLQQQQAEVDEMRRNSFTNFRK